MMDAQDLAMWMPGWPEMVIIAGVGLVIFGRRLPDVARSVGKSIVEFKKGIRDVKDDVNVQSRIESQPDSQPQTKSEPAAEAASPKESANESPAPK